MSIVAAVLRVSSLGGQLKAMLDSNAFTHVAAVLEENKEVAALFPEMILPILDRSGKDLEELLVLFTAIADNRSQALARLQEFRAKREPARLPRKGQKKART